MRAIASYSLSALAALAIGASLAAAGPAPAYSPKAGRQHPPLALWNLEHQEVVSLAGLRGKKVLLIHFASWSADCREDVPLWYEKTKPLVNDGKLVVVGVAQEQHPDRCRLFAQWKELEGPILQDPVNITRVRAVPVMTAIDEHGIVQDTQPKLETFEKDFVNKTFKGEANPVAHEALEPPDARVTRRMADEARSAASYCDHAEALLIAGEPAQIVEAIDVYGQAIEKDKKLARAYFGLGVAYRMRYDGEGRQSGDFQQAVDAWTKALKRSPNHFIYRGRLSQYGPRPNKPVAFYNWVETARKEIAARGQTPAPLVAELIGAELNSPKDSPPGHDVPPKGDPKGAIKRDEKGLIQIEQVVVMAADRSQAGRIGVHLTFRPNVERDGHWHNEAEPLRVWIAKTAGVKIEPQVLEFAGPKESVTDEPRTLSFDVEPGKKAKKKLTAKGYALYNACEGRSGTALLLRQDLTIQIER